VSSDDLSYTIKLMEKHGAVEESLRYAQGSPTRPRRPRGLPDSAPRQALMALADYVVRREK